MVEWCREHVAALTSVDIGPGLHFVQEDRPHEVGRALRKWYEGL
jgi:haloalkane dehalogenase